MTSLKILKNGKKNLFIVCNSCQNSLLSYQNETMPHGKVLCWRKTPWVFFLWERYVLVNCLTGCLRSDKEMGTTVTKHSQDPQSEFAGSLAQLCWEASIAHLFLLDFFFLMPLHTVLSQSPAQSFPFAAAAPSLFQSCLIGFHLSGQMNISPPPFHLQLLAVSTELLPSLLQAGCVSLLVQQVVNSIHQLKMVIFNPGFFQVYENYSCPSQTSHFGCLLWHTLEMVCHGFWALSWIRVRWSSEVRLKSSLSSLPLGKSVRL